MSDEISILADGTCKIGFGEADITPEDNLASLAMAGYSVSGQFAQHPPESRLLAKTLFVQDADGQHVAMCFMDLLSGSLLLWERVCDLLSKEIDKSRILLVGSHTHNGPGHYFGSKLYDSFAQKTKSNPNVGKTVPDLVKLLSQKISESILKAKGDLQDGRLVIVRSRLWKLATNRSFEAFKNNPYYTSNSWNTKGFPGYPHPSGLHELQKSVDPRVTTWLAFRAKATDPPLALFSTVPCHSTCLGPPFKHYSGDWPGNAAQILANDKKIGLTDTKSAFALSAAGDASPLPVKSILAGDGKGVQGKMFMVDRATVVAQHLSDVVKDTIAKLEPKPGNLALTLRSGTWVPNIKPVVGRPLLAGAEDGKGPVLLWPKFNEGDRWLLHVPFFPQSPKWAALGPLQKLFGSNVVQTSGKHPIAEVQFQSGKKRHVASTIPGEITMAAGFEIEEMTKKNRKASSASIISNTNDYMGYITTVKEYMKQHYEGGHTLYGRESIKKLSDVLAKL